MSTEKICPKYSTSKGELKGHEGQLHILAVSNHWEAKNKLLPYSGVFIDSQLESLRHAGLTVSTFDISMSHSPITLLKKWKQLRTQVKISNPDLIHSQCGSIVSILSAFLGRPFVVSFCGPDLLGGAPVHLFRRVMGHLLSNFAAFRAVGIICKSEGLRQALWWRKSHAMVIPNGVDLNLFSPGSQQEARKKLGWGLAAPIVITYIRNTPQYKGLDLAEASMKFLLSRLPDAELRVVSNVPHHQMPLLYRAADVLLCTSKSEGSPNVVKEALACNLPVVAVPVGDVLERLEGVCPSAVVERDPTVIGEALFKILRDRKRSNGRECVRHLALDRIVHEVINVYHQALNLKDK